MSYLFYDRDRSNSISNFLKSYSYTLFIGSAVCTVAAGAFIFATSTSQKRRGNRAQDSSDKPKRDKFVTSAIRYPLSLHGRIDRIFEDHGPIPFEFNSEVVEVFDDMVSRSVPLYCEVMDLLLYWCHKYFRPGTSILDLGCSTGTTLDVIARSFENDFSKSADIERPQPMIPHLELVGVDNSPAMVSKCRSKLQWAVARKHSVSIIEGDILSYKMENCSFVIMNYTLQFIPVSKRNQLINSIFRGLTEGGILFISEKVRSESPEFQETNTRIYEDFKIRRGYSRREIERKKEALMNVLVPFTEEEIRENLLNAGFSHVDTVAKWNNFTSFVARKSGHTSLKIRLKNKEEPLQTPHLDELFDHTPVFLSSILSTSQLSQLGVQRSAAFSDKISHSEETLANYDEIARLILSLPKGKMGVTTCKVHQPVLEIGSSSDLSDADKQIWKKCSEALRPWKKGPLELYGISIDTEWRSDWKWSRIEPHLPPLKDTIICDLGCGNGYFLFRLLDKKPKQLIGIDPNLHAWLEFKAFKRFSGVENIHLELLRDDSMILFQGTFDMVFCLGVLYHTPDPIGMLRDIRYSMKKNAHLIVDCAGIPGKDALAILPRKKYAGMSGVYFIPTLSMLKNWLHRSNFTNLEVIFAEKLSTEEQRSTEWAPVHSSLAESLDPTDTSMTIEGYPAPHRFYVKAKRG